MRRKQGYEVTYVRNFTDIDDKIIKRANEVPAQSNPTHRSASLRVCSDLLKASRPAARPLWPLIAAARRFRSSKQRLPVWFLRAIGCERGLLPRRLHRAAAAAATQGVQSHPRGPCGCDCARGCACCREPYGCGGSGGRGLQPADGALHSGVPRRHGCAGLPASLLRAARHRARRCAPPKPVFLSSAALLNALRAFRPEGGGAGPAPRSGHGADRERTRSGHGANRERTRYRLTRRCVGRGRQDIVALIEKIIANGHAYAVEGDVYFAVDSLPGRASPHPQPPPRVRGRHTRARRSANAARCSDGTFAAGV